MGAEAIRYMALAVTEARQTSVKNDRPQYMFLDDANTLFSGETLPEWVADRGGYFRVMGSQSLWFRRNQGH